MDTDRTERGRVTVRRVDVRGAAEVLDISAEAVRKRIARGTIPHEKDEEGNVWVLLDGQEDGDRTASGHREDGSTMPLLSRMEDEIAYLRSELDQERESRTEERRRHDTLMATLMQRLPELEAPEDAQESTQPRSWWRKFFGF